MISYVLDGLLYLVVLGSYVGLLFLFECGGSLCNIVRSCIVLNREPFSKRYGSWAVITGSIDGIGKEYAMNIASKGVNVFLISRTESKLIRVAEEILSKYSVEVQWLAIDFSRGFKVYDIIRSALDGIEVGILVNNVGFDHRNPLTFDQLSQEELQNCTLVNIQPTLGMTHMLLPQMKARRRGLIVNISSCAARIPMPLVSLYAASKAFVSNFTLALQEELRDVGVECQLETPLFEITNTKQQWINELKLPLNARPVDKFTKYVISMFSETNSSTGHSLMHWVQFAFWKLMPAWLGSKIVHHFLRPYAKNVESNPGEEASTRNYKNRYI